MSHLEFAERRVIVTAAPNGARRTTEDHPAIPVTPDQLAACAESLLEAGVAVLHLHVRDLNQAHTLSVDAYRAAIDAIRARVGQRLIIQVTTEAVGRYTRDEQMALVRALEPEAVSLSLAELCPDESSEADAAVFYRWVERHQIWAQHILYSPREVARFDALRRKGFFGREHPYCLFVLGRYGTAAEGRPEELASFLEAGEVAAFPWAVCCFGRAENEAMIAATAAGGHVRIGFENNLWRPDGSLASDNAELIGDYLASRPDDRRRVATAEEIRGLFW